MKKTITEQKFEEAKEAQVKIQEIATFNAKSITVLSGIYNMKSNEIQIAAAGNQDFLLAVLGEMTKAMATAMYKEHPCSCVPIEILTTLAESIEKGIDQAEKEGSKSNDEKQ
ncbi:hypothetical protein [Listeria fleischmannii]|uniref:Uncharacterized protein n=1 Tax=Listeria fleischmannii FSL S10-1203 TaxID=1265822 RepID=W7DLM8_9LIST|nr:hypothetical protein [Listeria fleischmannii]EUJ53844.1 hypothetical protein MCOL2_10565 [Listeria fleischmannii FSL S10-1203]